jgi:hypothetical protein
VACTAVKQKAKAAAAVLRAGFEKWKKTKSLEVYIKTGAIVSIAWERDNEGTREALSPGSAARRAASMRSTT